MERLKELRKELKKTQKDVAAFLNITQSCYQNYEAGDTEPSIDNLIKLADLFSVSLDYLCGRQFSNEVGFLTKEQREFVKAYLQLNEYDQAFVYGQVAGLLAKY